jgi:hypothetical protein
MTISRKEAPIPDELPAARLYLEDIEEIVGILLQGGAGTKEEVVQVCDQILDLPKIAKSTTHLAVLVRGERGSHYIARFVVSHSSTEWSAYALTTEQAWAAYRKLEALFEKRRLPLRNLLHSHKALFYVLQGMLSSLILLTPLILLSDLAAYRVALSVTLAVAALAFLTLWAGLRRHSIVILRNSWDHAARREELKTKIYAGTIPAIIGTLVGIVGTLIVLYVQHKYWP